MKRPSPHPGDPGPRRSPPHPGRMSAPRPRYEIRTRLRHTPRAAPSFRVSQRRTAPHRRKARKLPANDAGIFRHCDAGVDPTVTAWAMRKKGRSKNESAATTRTHTPAASGSARAPPGARAANARPANVAPTRGKRAVAARGVSHADASAENKELTARRAAAGVPHKRYAQRRADTRRNSRRAIARSAASQRYVRKQPAGSKVQAALKQTPESLKV